MRPSKLVGQLQVRAGARVPLKAIRAGAVSRAPSHVVGAGAPAVAQTRRRILPSLCFGFLRAVRAVQVDPGDGAWFQRFKLTVDEPHSNVPLNFNLRPYRAAAEERASGGGCGGCVARACGGGADGGELRRHPLCSHASLPGNP